MAKSEHAGQASGWVYRQTVWTRLTHWSWAVCLFFLLLSGLQIFNAHPALYVGEESGVAYGNAVLTIGMVDGDAGRRGITEVAGYAFDTTGLLGLSEAEGRLRERAFPAWATIPSGNNLATGRVIHFFFAWIFVATVGLWLVAGIATGHIRRDLLPSFADLKALPRDIAAHVRLHFHHGRRYNVLQKLAYGGVLFVAFPLMILTGLAMSPGFNAAAPWITDMFGGRQSARTLHFVAMAALVAFFVVHMAMILAAGPLNELRSIVTGWYRADPDREH